MIRVIAGTAKGKRLHRVAGEGTRPIGDRVKEALFNIIGPEIEGAQLLDLFAGTGSVGIEALSRGAYGATFVEVSPHAVKTIQKNLEITNLADKAVVRKQDVFGFLLGDAKQTYDYIYIAPPQYRQLWVRTLEQVDQKAAWMNPDAWVIVQIDPIEYYQIELANLVPFDQRKYGQTQLDFYEFPGE